MDDLVLISLLPQTLLCSIGLTILADGGNPFAAGQASAQHAEFCARCGNDPLAMGDDLEGQG